MIGKNLLLWLGCCIFSIYARVTLPEIYKWRYIEYWYDTLEEKAEAIQSGTYNLKTNFPMDVEVLPDGRVFVAILRKTGVPASLTVITNGSSHGGGRYLKAYPDWTWADINECQNIIDAHRIAQDECNRLWVLDSGKIDGNVGGDVLCPPKLLAFDMSTDKLIKRVEIPEKFAKNSNGDGFLINLVIDTMGDDCEDTRVYMADIAGYGLVVYNGKKIWRIESPAFEADPDHEEFSVHGTNFDRAAGLFGLSITRDGSDPLERLLYFRPLSSLNMYHTKIADLQLNKDDQSNFEYSTEPTELQSQSVTQAFSSEGILFFSDVTALSILCWNRHKPFTQENIVTVAQDETTLQWASGVKIRQGPEGEELWVMTDRWQGFETNSMDFTETNFRILSAKVEDLVSGTNCEIA